MSAAAVKKRTFGVIAEFGSAAELYRAAERVRDQGYRFWDAHSPFPIHGLNEAMGLKKSHLLEYIPTSFLFPLIVRGKPVDFFTVPAFFPIMFELTILFAGFTAFFGVFVMNRLPRLHHPLFDHAPFARVTEPRGFYRYRIGRSQVCRGRNFGVSRRDRWPRSNGAL